MPRTKKVDENGNPIKKPPPFVREVVLQYYKDNGIIWEPDEVMFHNERKWRFDFANTKYMIALEIEGGIWGFGGHNRGKAFKDDIEKYNEATSIGWRLLRTVPSQCCMEEILTQVIRTFEMVKKLRGLQK